NLVSYRSGPANWVDARRRITLRDRDERSSLAIHVCFLRETGSSGSTTRNMEETGVLEKVNLSGFCYLALNQVENTPLVRQLLEIIRTQQDRIQQLEDEILRLKGLKTRPVIAPSPLERPPRPPREPGQKWPGSAKRSKTAQLVITDEVVVPLA